jgi:hypothetical protein
MVDRVGIAYFGQSHQAPFLRRLTSFAKSVFLTDLPRPILLKVGLSAAAYSLRSLQPYKLKSPFEQKLKGLFKWWIA